MFPIKKKWTPHTCLQGIITMFLAWWIPEPAKPWYFILHTLLIRIPRLSEIKDFFFSYFFVFWRTLERYFSSCKLVSFLQICSVQKLCNFFTGCYNLHSYLWLSRKTEFEVLHPEGVSLAQSLMFDSYPHHPCISSVSYSPTCWEDCPFCLSFQGEASSFLPWSSMYPRVQQSDCTSLIVLLLWYSKQHDANDTQHRIVRYHSPQRAMC